MWKKGENAQRSSYRINLRVSFDNLRFWKILIIHVTKYQELSIEMNKEVQNSQCTNNNKRTKCSVVWKHNHFHQWNFFINLKNLSLIPNCIIQFYNQKRASHRLPTDGGCARRNIYPWSLLFQNWRSIKGLI